MKRPCAAFLALVVLLSPTVMSLTASAQNAPTPTAGQSVDPHANETKAQRDARMHWWREARFGMFIHWGLYAVPAGVYNGKPIGSLGRMDHADAPTSPLPIMPPMPISLTPNSSTPTSG